MFQRIKRTIDEYNESDIQTKFFILNWIVYGLILFITLAYCYARLDFVRSYQSPSSAAHQTKNIEIKP